MKGRYYCEYESPIYRQIIAEKLKLEKKQTKGTKKGKRKVRKCEVTWGRVRIFKIKNEQEF